MLRMNACVNICPAGAKDPEKKAIVMKPFDGQRPEHNNFDYGDHDRRNYRHHHYNCPRSHRDKQGRPRGCDT